MEASWPEQCGGGVVLLQHAVRQWRPPPADGDGDDGVLSQVEVRDARVGERR